MILNRDMHDLEDKFIDMQKTIMPEIAIEVGAHEATFSSSVSASLGIQSFAFEAFPLTFKKYSKVFAKNKYVNYLNYAVSDYNGEAKFLAYDNSQDALANGIKQRVGGVREWDRGDVVEYKVPATTLDSFFQDHRFASASLWIDVEGASREVLLGATELIKKAYSVFIETEDLELWEDQWKTGDVINFMNSSGFRILDIETVYQHQSNIIFIRRDS